MATNLSNEIDTTPTPSSARQPAAVDGIVDTSSYPIADRAFAARCKAALDRDGILILPGFLQEPALDAVREEALGKRQLAYYCDQAHTVFLRMEADPSLPSSHPANQMVVSTKGCITDDQVSDDCPLRTVYDDPEFQHFLCQVLDEKAVYPYADELSSINIHYAGQGQELGWHFDKSSFAITLLIQRPEAGGEFEYFRDIGPDDGETPDYTRISAVMDGTLRPRKVSLDAGALVLFRGRTAMHRVTPVAGDTTRLLAVLAYNSEPDIALSKDARLTFYGRE